MTTAFGYTRVSTTRQERISPQVQAEKIAAFCQEKGWKLECTLHEARSGRKERDELTAAAQLACASGGVLVVYDMTRLFRNAKQGLIVLDSLRDAGAFMYSVADRQDTTDQTAFGKLLRTFMLMMGQYFSDQSGEKIAASNAKTEKRLGYRTQGQQPYGFDIDLDSGVRVPVESEQKTIAVARSLRRSRSLALVAEALNTRGYVTRAGNQWRAEGVRRILGERKKRKSPAGSAPHGVKAITA